jgi:hypothetical protein
MGGAYMELTRGAETVSVGPNTQLAITDKRTSGKPFTTVKQSFGTIAVEAEVENVQHFAVQTPYLAAVVKGTKFTVKSDKTGAAVSVQRGHVAVEDNKDRSHVTLSVGQRAVVDTAGTAGEIAVSGTGTLPEVFSATGQPVEASASYADLLAAEKLAEQRGKLLETPEAKAAAEAAKKAADAAKKAAQAHEKDDKKAAQAAEKAAKDADKSVSKGDDGSADSSNSGSGSDGGNGNSDKGKGKSDH